MSWVLYLLPIGLAVVGVVAAVFGPIGWIVAAVCFAAVAIFAVRAWFIRWTTEIAVTNLRVIYAQGFVQRRSVEIHMDKVESVDVDQSVLG
ncbi:MAG: PH domain-containing protein, partial [Methyloceanibacter sp.]|nr:PH domain-containing protein [Methyloceanibacter sp.]